MRKNVLNFSLLLITVFLVLSLVGCGSDDTNTTNTGVPENTEEEIQNVQPEEGYSLFVSTDEKLSFVYNNDWTSQDGSSQQAVQIFISPDTVSQFCYAIETLPTVFTTTQYADIAKGQLKAGYTEIDFVKDETIKIGPHDGYQLQYDLLIGEQPVRLRQSFVVKDKVAYLFLYTTTPDRFDNYVDVADKMLDSVRIK